MSWDTTVNATPPRVFRIDRIDGDPHVGAARSFEPPPGIDPARFVRDDPLTYGEDRPVEARVLVDASRAGWVVEQLGEEAVVERRDDGSVEVALPVVNRAAFRSWLLDLLDHAEVLGPTELRADLVAWLEAVVQRGADEPAPARRTAACGACSRSCRTCSRTRVSRSSSSRERFEVSEGELERDLELLPLCGLPPYTADRLIDVWVVDGGVEIRLAEYFERPLRLTPAEGLALLAAGRALLSVPGSDEADRSRLRSPSSRMRSTRAAASPSTSEGAITSKSCRTRPRRPSKSRSTTTRSRATR